MISSYSSGTLRRGARTDLNWRRRAARVFFMEDLLFEERAGREGSTSYLIRAAPGELRTLVERAGGEDLPRRHEALDLLRRDGGAVEMALDQVAAALAQNLLLLLGFHALGDDL